MNTPRLMIFRKAHLTTKKPLAGQTLENGQEKQKTLIIPSFSSFDHMVKC